MDAGHQRVDDKPVSSRKECVDCTPYKGESYAKPAKTSKNNRSTIGQSVTLIIHQSADQEIPVNARRHIKHQLSTPLLSMDAVDAVETALIPQTFPSLSFKFPGQAFYSCPFVPPIRSMFDKSLLLPALLWLLFSADSPAALKPKPPGARIPLGLGFDSPDRLLDSEDPGRDAEELTELPPARKPVLRIACSGAGCCLVGLLVGLGSSGGAGAA